MRLDEGAQNIIYKFTFRLVRPRDKWQLTVDSAEKIFFFIVFDKINIVYTKFS